MKKYLMTGMAAIAFCAAFTSCSKNEDLYDPSLVQKMEEEAAIEKYAKAFETAFGKVGPNVDWGFGATRGITRTYNVEGNLWHDPAYYNLEYDAKVTTAEKNLVFNYVNNPTNVRTVDQISFDKYWVAQIWNGKNDANADGVKAPVSTSYPDQNGQKTTTVGGGHMDKLDILESPGKWTHCNNFNAANNENWKEDGEGGRTLMWESGTLSFRYINSDGSHMSERYIIVPGEYIDASLKGFYYVCFDFEKGYTDAEKAAETSYGTCEKWIPQDGNPNGGYWQSENWNLSGFYNDANDSELIAKLKQNKGTDKIQNIVFKGYLYGQQHYVGDGYYNDWIVRISPAKVRNTTPTYRVIAEDLNANDPTDFDFNDVVFDVEPNAAGNAAKIILQACGGIYRLEVAGVEVHGAYGYSPNSETGLYPMINTGDGPSGLGSRTIVESYAGDFSSDSNIRETIKNITIKVWKPSSSDKTKVSEFTLEANNGKPASKVLVDKDFGIVPEHQSIANSYGNFTSYVRGEWQDAFWWKY